METPETTVVIETPKESRLKFKLDKAAGLYKVDCILPKGQRFPFNFGFIPRTQAADGDPIDVLLILDEILSRMLSRLPAARSGLCRAIRKRQNLSQRSNSGRFDQGS
jgi:inorganic pyrophosphatase